MKLSVLLVLLSLSFNASANKMAAESKQFCEKIRSCTLEEMEGEDISPEMEAMLKPMIDDMCNNIMAQMNPAETDKALEDDAVACMKSMNALSCNELMNGEAETKQCKDFQAKAEK